MSSASDRRRAIRLERRLPAHVAIFAAEETVPVEKREAEVMDLSETGLRLRIPELPRNVYTSLLKGPRYARVWTSLKESEEESAVYGDIRWVDFRETETPPECRIGVLFTFLGSDGEAALREAIRRLGEEAARVSQGSN